MNSYIGKLPISKLWWEGMIPLMYREIKNGKQKKVVCMEIKCSVKTLNKYLKLYESYLKSLS